MNGFKNNKYYAIYYSIVNRALSRTHVNTYTEKHHIIPRSIGGSDNNKNIAILTAREHFICHMLLPKFTSGSDKQKMICAFILMSGNNTYTSRKYDFFRNEYTTYNSYRNSGKNNPMYGIRRTGKSNPFYGKKHTEETKQKISDKRRGHSDNTGVPKSTEHRKKLSEARKKSSIKYKFFHQEHGFFYGSTGDLGREFDIRRSEIYKLAVGYYKSYKGWKVC